MQHTTRLYVNEHGVRAAVHEKIGLRRWRLAGAVGNGRRTGVNGRLDVCAVAGVGAVWRSGVRSAQAKRTLSVALW